MGDVAQLPELAVVADRDDERPIGRRKGFVGNDARMGIAHPAADNAARQPRGALVDEPGERGAHEADRHVLPGTGPLPGGQSGQDADLHLEPGQQVDDGDPGLCRLAVR